MLFPVLETENLVQENDKTRLSGIKSYVSDGDPITSIQVTPYKGATPIVVTATLSKNWFIDYQYGFLLDVDSTNNEINFNEGAGGLTATVATGQYTLTALASAIKTALDSAGGLTYTVSVNSENKITISTTANFSILPKTGTSTASLLTEIGFSGYVEDVTDLTIDASDFVDFTGASTYTGLVIETVDKKVSLLVDNGSTTQSVTKTIKVISELSDALFSDDSMLEEHEPNILEYVRKGRSTFKDQHRLAQTQIFAYMDKEGFVDAFNRKYTKKAAVLPDEFLQWSKFVTLRLIFEGLSNAVDDIFEKKSNRYSKKEYFFRDRAVLRIDVDRDGDVTLDEEVDPGSCVVLRR